MQFVTKKGFMDIGNKKSYKQAYQEYKKIWKERKNEQNQLFRKLKKKICGMDFLLHLIH